MYHLPEYEVPCMGFMYSDVKDFIKKDKLDFNCVDCEIAGVKFNCNVIFECDVVTISLPGNNKIKCYWNFEGINKYHLFDFVKTGKFPCEFSYLMIDSEPIYRFNDSLQFVPTSLTQKEVIEFNHGESFEVIDYRGFTVRVTKHNTGAIVTEFNPRNVVDIKFLAENSKYVALTLFNFETTFYG